MTQQGLEQTLLSGYSSLSECQRPRKTSGSLAQILSAHPSARSSRVALPDGVIITTASSPSAERGSGDTICLARGHSHAEILFTHFGKFLFDAEEAFEKVLKRDVDVDLCDQRGDISGASLLPAFGDGVNDFAIFAPRELHYPVLLEKVDAFLVAYPQPVVTSGSTSTAEVAKSSLNVPKNLNRSPSLRSVAKTARTTGKKSPQRSANKNAEPKKNQKDQQPPPQQQQQQQQQLPKSSGPDSFSEAPPNVGVRFASAEMPTRDDRSIKDFVHPLLLKLFRPDSDLDAATEAIGTNVNAIAQANGNKTPTLSAQAAETQGRRSPVRLLLLVFLLLLLLLIRLILKKLSFGI